jgi:hypothetical protein
LIGCFALYSIKVVSGFAIGVRCKAFRQLLLIRYTQDTMHALDSF